LSRQIPGKVVIVAYLSIVFRLLDNQTPRSVQHQLKRTKRRQPGIKYRCNNPHDWTGAEGVCQHSGIVSRQRRSNRPQLVKLIKATRCNSPQILSSVDSDLRLLGCKIN